MTRWNPADTPNFTVAEMRCRCGCGGADMDGGFMARLQGLRDALGPLRVSSGFRCPDHNARVSSTGSNGPHTTGKAADIGVFGVQAHGLLIAAAEHGFTGFGIRQNGARGARFVHLDILMADETNGLRPWLWSY